jgi:hypothetical protein
MSLMNFFQIIDDSFIGKAIDKRLNLVASIDPERIYLENIRSFYNIPISIAKLFCEMALKENLFKKGFGIECPNDSCNNRLIATYNDKREVPDTILCESCQLLEKDKFEFNANEFKVIEFYKLNKEAL